MPKMDKKFEIFMMETLHWCLGFKGLFVYRPLASTRKHYLKFRLNCFDSASDLWGKNG